MGRKAKYCIFHSLEGSGNQNRNNEHCGNIEPDETITKETQVLSCQAFQAYGPVTKQQRKEIAELQRIASANGLRKEFTLRKIMDIHCKNNWDWTVANTFIRDILLSYQLRSITTPNFTNEESIFKISPEFVQQMLPNPTDIGPVLSINGPTPQETQAMAEMCHSQLTQIVKALGSNATLWNLNEDLLTFNYLLECGVRSVSVPHFQQALRVLHANIKPTIWKNKEHSLQWVSIIKQLDQVPAINDHIEKLIQSIDFCEAHEDEQREQEFHTCCSATSICCNVAPDRHHPSQCRFDVPSCTNDEDASCVVCVCTITIQKPNTYCFCKMMWVG